MLDAERPITPVDHAPEPLPDTPGAALDQIGSRTGWTDRQRVEALGRLVERFPAAAVAEAVAARLRDLRGAEAETVLRLVEIDPRPEWLRALAAALVEQPDLPAEWEWEALAVLAGAGAIAEHPLLAERWNDLNEVLDEEGSIGQLVDQLEDDAEGVWLALQGLGAVEPEVRSQIIAGLSDQPLGPGLVEFLRLLAYASDPASRGAALDVLARGLAAQNAAARLAWQDLERNHPDPAVAETARRQLGSAPLVPASPMSRTEIEPSALRLDRSLVTSIDGRGRASVVLSSTRGTRLATAAFLCDIETGIREVFGEVSDAPGSSGSLIESLAGELGRDVVEDDHPLALALLAGCLTLCGPTAPPALRFWIEATAGSVLEPRPFPASIDGWDPRDIPFREMAERSRAVLDRFPDWLDGSALTYELAEELQLRERGASPDPRRDVGAYRFLFEHRLRGQLERYRRMLLWSAWFWRSAGEEALGRSAMALAWQLSDAQHVVPGHPFTVELTTRSLAAAQAALRDGNDPRRPPPAR